VLAPGGQGSVTVSYADIVPDTTIVVPPSTVLGLITDPDPASTLLLSSLPATLQTGDILAVGISGPTPDGFLGKVQSVSAQSNGTFMVTTVPATLVQAMPRGMIDPSWQDPRQSDSVNQEGLSCGAGASLSVTGSLTLSAGGDFAAEWDSTGLTSASADASVTLSEQMQASVEGAAGCTVNDQPLGPPVTFDPIPVDIGIPVVIVPTLQFFLNGSASTGAAVTSGQSLQVTATAGLQYASGQVTPASSLTTSFSTQPPAPSLDADLSASVGPALGLLIDDVAGPELDFAGSLHLHADPLNSPAWTLTGGVHAGGGLTIPLLDFDKSDPDIIDFSTLLASSPPVITTSALASGQVGTAYDQTLQATAGTPPYTWSLASGSLPPGLSLNASTGDITGTPMQPGSYTFTAQAADSSNGLLTPHGQTAAMNETITISGTGPASWGVAPAAAVRATAIDAASSSDVWAVGSNSIEHWDGSSWTTSLTLPGAQFSAVHAISANDAWVVGYQTLAGGLLQTLTLHWDGASWTTIPSPDVGNRDNQLTSVTGMLTGNLWAVGYYNDPANGFQEPLAEHWDGRNWTVATLPNDGNGNNTQLLSVSMDTPSDAWAVGYTIGTTFNSQATPVTEHWSGGTWQVVPSPVIDPSHPWELTSVAAVAPDNAWAVGTVFNNPPVPPVPDLIEHWDGASWTIQPTPDPAGAQFSSLTGISARSANDIWAVGTWADTNGVSHTLIKHWDGASWSVTQSPDPGAFTNALQAVVAITAADAWAVGSSSDNVNSATQPLYLRYG